MSERYFENNLPDTAVEEIDPSDDAKTKEGFAVNLPEPYFPNSNAFLKAALNLKDELLFLLWSNCCSCWPNSAPAILVVDGLCNSSIAAVLVVQATWIQHGFRCRDPTIYTGLAGTAFLCFRSYQITGNVEDLALSSDIIDSCSAVAPNLRHHVTFLCGKAGVYALGAVVAKYKGDKNRSDFFLTLFCSEVAAERALSVGPEEGGFGMPYELLYGRAGFLWAALFLNKHLGDETIPWRTLGPIVDAVLAGGRAGASHTLSPLMYQWHGTRYWGAAHGLAGIMHVLLHFPLSKEDAADVKRTLRYMIKNRLSQGNYPSSEGNSRDKLVQWCHGAPGVAMALCKAAQVFPEEPDFRQAAKEAGEVTWRKGLLRKVGLCHGISGNAYTFLALNRLTRERIYLHRAKAFAGFLYNKGGRLIASGEMHGGDNPHSLFEGLAGTACLWFDMVKPEESRFPGFEL